MCRRADKIWFQSRQNRNLIDKFGESDLILPLDKWRKEKKSKWTTKIKRRRKLKGFKGCTEVAVTSWTTSQRYIKRARDCADVCLRVLFSGFIRMPSMGMNKYTYINYKIRHTSNNRVAPLVRLAASSKWRYEIEKYGCINDVTMIVMMIWIWNVFPQPGTDCSSRQGEN